MAVVDDNEQRAEEEERPFVPRGALIFILIFLLILTLTWVGMYMLMLHRGLN